MDMVMTLVWYPWTEGQGGPAGTQGAFKTLDLALNDADWPRLPNVGETIFFDDGGAANIEQVGWKLTGTAYLYLGKRYEKKGDQLQAWLNRGFAEREPVQQAPTAVEQPAVAAPAAAASANEGSTPASGADAPTVPSSLPPMPGDQAVP